MFFFKLSIYKHKMEIFSASLVHVEIIMDPNLMVLELYVVDVGSAEMFDLMKPCLIYLPYIQTFLLSLVCDGSSICWIRKNHTRHKLKA